MRAAGHAEAPGVLRVAVVGDLDLATTDQFLTAVVAQLGNSPLRRVEVDMTQSEFIDSTGLGALVELRRAAHALGADTKLTNVDHRTERLLRIVGLESTFLDQAPLVVQSRSGTAAIDDERRGTLDED